MTHEREHYYIQPHPFHKRAYQIMRGRRGCEGQPVGEYIVMDKQEKEPVTAQKVQALQACLNDKEIGLDLTKPQKQFVSFQRVGVSEDEEMPEQIVFYNNIKGDHGETRREINAILTFAKNEIAAQAHPQGATA